MRKVFWPFWAFFYALSLTACLSGSGSESETEIDLVPTEPPPPAEEIADPSFDPSKVVCNPFEHNSSQERTQGIIGKLTYLEEENYGLSYVQDYFDFGIRIDEIDIYMNRLHIPTRPFDRGFELQTGQVIQTLNGDTLYEWFAMELHSMLHLGPQDEQGQYQLAVLSDDGAKLYLDQGNGLELLIDNDRTHPTKMKCATEPVSFSVDDMKELFVEYFQGPRFHISLMILWRPWPEDPNDPFCNKQGNDFYFNSRMNPPEPTANYQALLDRGWRALEPENYSLPAEDEENPCNVPAPDISNFFLISNSSTDALFQWRTNLPATSEMILTEVATGQEINVQVRPVNYVTSHSVRATGLKANTLYSARAKSASLSGLSTETGELRFRTRR